MAKKVNPEDEALYQGAEMTSQEGMTETADGKQEDSQESTTATVTAPIVRVKVHIMEEVDSLVAGTRYSYAKGKEVAVPSDVAAILVNARKAYRI